MNNVKGDTTHILVHVAEDDDVHVNLGEESSDMRLHFLRRDSCVTGQLIDSRRV